MENLLAGYTVFGAAIGVGRSIIGEFQAFPHLDIPEFSSTVAG